MKNLLYIAPVIIDLDNLNGVSKKVLNHFKVFSKYYNVEMISYGLNCLYHFHEDKIDTIPLNKLNRRLRLYEYIKQIVSQHKQYNFIYIRYLLSDFLFINLLKLLHKKSSKIVIEIPTYPYKSELLKSKNGLIRWVSDLTSRIFLKKYVKRIITYSNDDSIFGIKTINTINGIIYDDIKPVQKKVNSESIINLISVSVTMPCHGYDRIIEGLKNYYNNGGERKIIYHLVGNGPEIVKYEKLIEKYKLETNILLYGFKSGKELEEIYDLADFAINSLGIHRIGLKTESTLKSKEYAAKGLPMISSYEIDAFTTVDNEKYVFRVSSDELAMDILSFLKFYEKIYNDSSKDLASEIRSASKTRSDMEVTLQGVIDYFNTNEKI